MASSDRKEERGNVVAKVNHPAAGTATDKKKKEKN